MVLTLSRQFVTLTGTGKAVRVFFFSFRFAQQDIFVRRFGYIEYNKAMRDVELILFIALLKYVSALSD